MAFLVGILGVMLACAQSFTGAAAKAFFAVDADPFLGCVVASRSSIHASIGALLQKGAEDLDVEELLAKLQEQLRPTFEVLPRNEYGRLGSAGVRYLLHRHFLHSRAWLVRGLAPDGRAWGASFPVQMLLKGAPEEVRVIVTDHLKGRGLTLREVAVLASLLENHVHADAMEKLWGVWRAQGLEAIDRVNVTTLQQVTSAHALTYFLPELFQDGKEISVASLAEAQRQAVLTYPTWQKTTDFLFSTARDVAASHESLSLGLGVAEKVVMRVLEQYGPWQDDECRGLKQKLVSLETPSRPGRVSVAAFYGANMRGQVEFGESVPYMRQLGVLDEAEPGNPHVIIPNYMNSPGNYIISSRHFATACIDECEDLLEHIERRVGAPAASVEQLAEIVGALPSSTQPTRTALPAPLLQKLAEVAAVHGDLVLLQGRLFALWLHHAYPRECPYPHVAGTTQPLLPQEFDDQNEGVVAAETMLGMLRTLTEVKKVKEAAGVVDPTSRPLPWDLEEELLQAEQPRAAILVAFSQQQAVFLLLVVAMAGVALASLATRVLSRTLSTARAPLLDAVGAGGNMACGSDATDAAEAPGSVVQ